MLKKKKVNMIRTYFFSYLQLYTEKMYYGTFKLKILLGALYIMILELLKGFFFQINDLRDLFKQWLGIANPWRFM